MKFNIGVESAAQIDPLPRASALPHHDGRSGNSDTP